LRIVTAPEALALLEEGWPTKADFDRPILTVDVVLRK
jgi:hypothetical protein